MDEHKTNKDDVNAPAEERLERCVVEEREEENYRTEEHERGDKKDEESEEDEEDDKNEEEEDDEVEDNFTVLEDSGRPIVQKPGQERYDLFPLDKVYLCTGETRRREGPYLVERAENGKYALCDENGVSVKKGIWFERKHLVLEVYFR